MRFEIFINDPIIHKAANIVETHYKDQAFLNILCGVERFNFTYHSGVHVAANIASSELKIQIKPYTSLSPWSKVIGYATDNTIYINTRKLDLPLKDRIENIRHEIFHLQDYSHKGNRVTEFNLRTVPYLGASLFVKYLKSIGVIE